MARCRRFSRLALLTFAVSAARGAPPGLPQGPIDGLHGSVSADGRAVQGSAVRLLGAGSLPGAAELLGATTTDVAGGFTLRAPGSG